MAFVSGCSDNIVDGDRYIENQQPILSAHEVENETSSNSEYYEQNNETSEMLPLEQMSVSDFIALSYLGVVRYLGHGAVHYDVWNNQSFVDEVWGALNYETWERIYFDCKCCFQEYEIGLQHNSLIFLTFFDNEINRRIIVIGSDDIASNEYGWAGLAGSDEHEVIYYSMPIGSFGMIYELLTNYTIENTNPEINLDIIREISLNYGILHFSGIDDNGAVFFREILKEDIGDFIAEWEIERWEYLECDGDESRAGSAIGFGGIEGNVGINRVHISLSTNNGIHSVQASNSNGSTVLYQIPNSAFETITSQFERFKDMGVER
jgi:hypothetical protein